MFWGSKKEDNNVAALVKTASAPVYRVHRIRVLAGDSAWIRRYAVSRPTGRTGDRLVKESFAGHCDWLRQYRYFTDDTVAAVAKILDLEGVVDVQVQEGSVDVTIGQAYNFSEVHRDVLSILRSAYFHGDDFEKVEVCDLQAETRNV
jgi:hypothetical protein